MKVNGFLVIGENKSCRFVKTKPSLEWSEIAISLTVNVPDDVFKRPAIHAEITISEDQIATRKILADTVNKVQDALMQTAGIELRIIEKE